MRDHFPGTTIYHIDTGTITLVQATDIETNTITLLQPTSLQRGYRIDLPQEFVKMALALEYVAFYVDDLVVSTHKLHIPGPYAYMDGFTGWINGSVAIASTTIMAVNYIFVGNNDLLQIFNGFINLPVVVQNTALTDNTPFNPSCSKVIAKRVLSIDSLSITSIQIGTGCYLLR